MTADPAGAARRHVNEKKQLDAYQYFFIGDWMMKRTILKTLSAMSVSVMLVFAFTACSSGPESKYEEVLTKVNPAWKVFEVKQEGNNTIIRVEASDVIPFAEAKKAMEALQAMDPKLTGYVEFYNKEVGMVLRKLEIVPAT